MPSLVKPWVPVARLSNQPTLRRDDSAFLLRPWRHGDAAQLKAAFQDPQIQKWCLHKLQTIPEGRDWVDRWQLKWRKRTGASWAIVDRKKPDIVLGQIGFRSLYLTDGLAEVSCWIMPKARQKHLGTDATRMLAAWAFDDLGLERLEIVHSTKNKASCPVALRAGFQIEGIKRHLQVHADGFHDMCLHSRISSDSGEAIFPAAPGAEEGLPLSAVPRGAAKAVALARQSRLAILLRFEAGDVPGKDYSEVPIRS